MLTKCDSFRWMTPQERAQVELLFQERESDEDIIRRLGESARSHLREIREEWRKERETLHKRLKSDPPEIDRSEIMPILRTLSIWMIELETRIDKLAER